MTDGIISLAQQVAADLDRALSFLPRDTEFAVGGVDAALVAPGTLRVRLA